MPSEFGPVKVHGPFSLQDFKKIKRDLGKFADYPARYIEVFQNLTQMLELDWEAVMLILTEKPGALWAAGSFGDGGWPTGKGILGTKADRQGQGPPP